MKSMVSPTTAAFLLCVSVALIAIGNSKAGSHQSGKMDIRQPREIFLEFERLSEGRYDNDGWGPGNHLVDFDESTCTLGFVKYSRQEESYYNPALLETRAVTLPMGLLDKVTSSPGRYTVGRAGHDAGARIITLTAHTDYSSELPKLDAPSMDYSFPEGTRFLQVRLLMGYSNGFDKNWVRQGEWDFTSASPLDRNTLNELFWELNDACVQTR